MISNQKQFAHEVNPVHEKRTGRIDLIFSSCTSWILLFVFQFGLIGCSVHVTPPLDPPHPTVVYLCDYGIHSSLLLPTGPGQYVEYLYGDWNWAALAHTSWLDALGAIFWSQQSTLGRRMITQSPGAKMPQPPDGPKSEILVTVNGDGCQAVINELNTRWEFDRVIALLPQPAADLYWYAKDDKPYSWLHDCNRETADELHEMGCRIDGFPVWSKFIVTEPAR